MSGDCAAQPVQRFPIQPQLSHKQGPLGVQAPRPISPPSTQVDAAQQLPIDPPRPRQPNQSDEDDQSPQACDSVLDEFEKALATADAKRRRAALPLLRLLIDMLGEHE